MTSGSPVLDSFTPTFAQDIDRNGCIELFEGLTVPPGVGIDNPSQNFPFDDEINGHSTFAPGPGPGGEFGPTVVFPLASGELVAGGVPEPASWAMRITGMGLVGAAGRRRRSAITG